MGRCLRPVQLKYEHDSAASVFRPFGATEDYPFYAWVYKGEVIWTPSPKLLVDSMVGRYWYSAFHNNQPGTTVAGNPWEDSVTTGSMGGPVIDTGSSYDTLNARIQNTTNINYFPTGFLWGKHALQFGYQWFPNTSFTPVWFDRPSGNYELLFSGPSSTGTAFNFNPGTPFEINTFNFPLHNARRT